MDSMRRFASDRPEIAMYEPEDDGYLLSKEPRSTVDRTFYPAERRG